MDFSGGVKHWDKCELVVIQCHKIVIILKSCNVSGLS